MSFSSRLKEKQEQENRTGSTTRRNRSEEPATPVNTFLARREEREREREREQQEKLKQAVQQDHSKEKSDFFRADREQARKMAQRLDASPNKKMYETLDHKPKNAGSPFAPIRQTPEQKVKVEEYTKYLAEKTKQERQQKQKREQEQQETKRILDKVGYQDGYQFKRYIDLPNEPDFAQTVEKAKANDPSWMERAQFWKKTSNPVEDAYRQMEKMWGKDGATQEDIREKTLKRTMGVGSESDNMLRKYALMTERERYTYDYVFEKAGKEAADKYLDSLQDTINLRSAQDKYTRDETTVPDPMKVPYNIGKSFGIGAESAVKGIGHLPDAILGRQPDYNITESEYYQEMLNSQAGGAERLAYNLASGLGNLAPSIAIAAATGGAGSAGAAGTIGKFGGKLSAWAAKGALGSGIMSAQMAGQTYRQDIMEGRPVEGAQMNAALTAADEYVTNWLLGGIAAYGGGAVGKVLKNSKVGQAAKQGISNALAKNPAIRRAVLGAANYGGDMLSEGTQEAVQDLTESIRKSMIYGDNLDLAGDLKDPQTWEDFALGALTAGILNAPGAISNNRAINQYGKSINPDYRDYVNGLSDIKPESYADPADYQEASELKQMAEEYAAKQANKEFVSNREKAEYAIRFQQFMENTMRHNEEKAARENAQNSQQATGTEADEQTYTEPETAEYEPYNEPEEAPTKVQNQTEPTQKTAVKQTVASQDVPNQTEAYRKPYGKNGQAALQKGYDGSIELSAYNKAFGRAYDAGYYNVSMDIAERSAIMSVLTNEQFVDAYKAGAQDYNTDNNIDLKTGQPKTVSQGIPRIGGLGTVSESATTPQRKVAEHIGKMTGLKINLVDGLGQTSAAGSYRNGEITISINSNDFNGTLTHELTHHIKQYSPKGYRMYTEIAVEAVMKSENTSLENLMESYENRYAEAGQELTREEIMDEVVADATQKFFNDPKFIDSIAKKDKTIAQRIVDFLSDVVDSIKQMMKNGSIREAAKGLEEDLRYYEDARDAWMHALSDASETYKADRQGQAEGQKEQYALEKPELVTDENIEENYEKVREMDSVADLSGNEFEKGEKDLVTQVSDFYKSIGGKVHNEVVGDIYLDRDSVKDDIGHGVGRAKAITFAAVPDILKNGYVLDYKKNWKNRGYDSAVIGAKVNISEGKYAGKYYGLAVVKLLDDNKMYLHEVHTTKAESVMPFKTPDLQGGKTRSDTYTLPPIYSILNKLMNVNGENQPEKIRLQLEDVDRAETDRHIEALLDENQALRDANKLLEKQFTLTPKNEVRQRDVEKVAKGLLGEYNSTYKPETLIKNLDKLYGYIRSAEHVDSAQLTEAATSIAKGILKQSRQVDTEMTQQYKDVRNQIKNTKIKISEQDKADMAVSGGYNEFRKRNFGRMKLGNDGIPVDSLYQELSALHPELFPEDITHPADQLVAIADALEQTEIQVQNPYKANLDEMAYMVGQDILQSYFDVRQEKPTFADRKEAEIQKVRREYSQKMREYKNNLKKQYEDNLYRVRRENIQEIQKLANAYKNLTATQQREQKEYYKKKMDDLRNEKNQALAAMQQKNREQTKRVRENQRAREAKKIIIKEAKTMQTWLLKPTDTKHIPEEIRTVVAEFLSNIDFSSNELNNNGIPTQRTTAWRNAKDAFEKIIKENGILRGKDGREFYMEIDPDLVERIEAIAKKAEGVEKLDNLDVYHMEELKKVVLSMKKAITEANTLKSNKRSGQLSILAEGIFNDLQDRKNHSEYLGVIGPADKMLNYDMLDAQTMFGKLGDNFKSLYNSLREGLDKKTIKLKNAQDHVEKLLRDNGISYKTLREWTGPEAKSGKYKTSGGTIELTISQVMSLYELNKRNQARTHMYERTGGIISAPRAGKMRIEDGKLILPKIEKAYRETKVTEADIARIINTLTPEQKALADGMQRFMGDDCAAWGNEVSMQMYGYMKYTARNYFPITVYDNHIHTEQGNLKNQQSTIKNLGFTKSTVEKANKPIVIEDIFDVYSRQVDQMSTYNAYVIPLSDLNKVFNYMDMRNAADGKSIKEEIERTYGKEGNKYIDKLIADINGSLNKDKNLWDKLSQNMKVASVAGNIRVALQQPTAYIRASMEIDAKYLSRGALTMTRKDQWDIMCKYAPIAQWKDWGFYRMDNSRQIKDVLFQTDSKTQKINNAFMIFAEKGDKLAWNRLWRACEFECMDRHPDLSVGTEAFYAEVGKRFSEVIDKTQVVDSVLHRTQIMRSERDSDKMLTAFMAEPLKTYNMLYRAASDVAVGKKGAKGRMAKAVAVYTAAALVTSMAAAIQDAMRDDDRDKKWMEKYWDNVWGNFKDNMNLINSIPYVKDAYGILIDGYTPNRPDVAAYQDLARALNRVKKLADGESSLTPQAVIIDVIQSGSKLFGSPVKSATRDLRAIVDTVINEHGSGSVDYTWLKQKYAIGSKDNLNLYAGMMIEAQRNGDKDLQKRIKTDLNKAEIDNETISNKIKSLIKGELISKDYIDPRIETAAQAKMEADTEAYKAAVGELIAEGYAGKLVTSVIDSRINQLSTGEEIDWEAEAKTDPDELYGEILTGEEDEEERSIYSSRDILGAVEQVDNTVKSLNTFKAISAEIIDSKTKAGKTKSEAISSIKSSITRSYKEKWIAAYLEGNRKEYEAIQAKLNVLRVDGKNIYSGTDYSSWRKAAKEKEREENVKKQ
ncbi:MULTISPECIES: hypothetical protein [Clostridia]|uniref:hypothetical protein n=1 Tax=Clostridium sp. TaxID=1506 RepID=UPI00258541C6|nr:MULTISPECIES: hypothetical protein [Clostridia]MCI6138501.1 hypothetical protein [Clostridium sp.]MDY4764851.1 hypothetical protein [Enterocloster clostridioformis]